MGRLLVLSAGVLVGVLSFASTGKGRGALVKGDLAFLDALGGAGNVEVRQNADGSLNVNSARSIPMVFAQVLTLPSRIKPRETQERGMDTSRPGKTRTEKTALVAIAQDLRGRVLLAGRVEIIDGQLSTMMDGTKVLNQTGEELTVWRDIEQYPIPADKGFAIENEHCVRVVKYVQGRSSKTIHYYPSSEVIGKNRAWMGKRVALAGVVAVLLAFVAVRRFSLKRLLVLASVAAAAGFAGWSVGYHVGDDALTRAQVARECAASVPPFPEDVVAWAKAKARDRPSLGRGDRTQ